jgi:hypothetical protein
LPGNTQFAAQVDYFHFLLPHGSHGKAHFRRSHLEGRTAFRPRARADARPAFVRSEIRSRSNSAGAAKIPNTSLPSQRAGVDRRTVAGQYLKADAARAEVVNDVDEVAQVSQKS